MILDNVLLYYPDIIPYVTETDGYSSEKCRNRVSYISISLKY